MNSRFVILTTLLVFACIFNIVMTHHKQEHFDLPNFVNVDEIDVDMEIKCENSNILGYSIKTDDEQFSKKIKGILYDGKNDINNTIKYLDGTVEWSKWIKNNNDDDILKDICKKMYVNMSKKLAHNDINIIYHTLNKYKVSLRRKDEIMMDFDFVFYKPKDFFAYHVNIICVINKVTMIRHFLNVEAKGQICEDKLHEHLCDDDNDNYVYVEFEQSNFYDETIPVDSLQSLKTEDEEVKKILSKNLKYNTESEDPDYIKNIDYEQNQQIVKNMFLGELNDNQQFTKTCVNSANIFKNYPYQSDIVIVNSEFD